MEEQEKSLQELGCLLLLLINALHHPHSDLAGAALSASIGRAVLLVGTGRETQTLFTLKRALFTLKRALLLPLPSSAPDHVYT